jgi:hypothetical protein
MAVVYERAKTHELEMRGRSLLATVSASPDRDVPARGIRYMMRDALQGSGREKS